MSPETPFRTGFAVGIFGLSVLAVGSCNLLLNDTKVQCSTDIDCSRFASAACNASTHLCVHRIVTSTSVTNVDASDGPPTQDGGNFDASTGSPDGAGASPGSPDGAGNPSVGDAPATSAINDDSGTADSQLPPTGVDGYAGGQCPDQDGDGVLDCDESVLINSDFRTGLTPWMSEPNIKTAYSMVDGKANPSSGAIAVTNTNQSDTSAGSTIGGASQCIASRGFTVYDMLMQTSLNAPVDPSVSAGTVLQFYASADCSGPLLNGTFMSALADGNTVGWRTIQSIVTTPGDTHSILVRLVVVKPFKNQPAQAFFDNILMRVR